MSLLDYFRRDLQDAVMDYQKIFTPSSPMPLHRQTDVKAIKEIIDDVGLGAIKLRAQLLRHLQKMQTGLFGISTNRSRLKTLLLSVLRDPQYSDMAFLFDGNARLFQENLQLNQRLSDFTFEYSCLKKQMIDLQNVNKQLQERLTKYEQGKEQISPSSSLLALS